MTVEMKPVKIFSTVKLREGNIPPDQYLSLFTVPQGQHMPQAPNEICPTCQGVAAGEMLTPEHTNLFQAGQFGSAIGDCRLDRVQAIINVPTVVVARFELWIAGLKQFEMPLSEMQESRDGEQPGREIERQLVARTDTFQGKLYILAPVERDVLVRVEFYGLAAREVR